MRYLISNGALQEVLQYEGVGDMPTISLQQSVDVRAKGLRKHFGSPSFKYYIKYS